VFGQPGLKSCDLGRGMFPPDCEARFGGLAPDIGLDPVEGGNLLQPVLRDRIRAVLGNLTSLRRACAQQ